MRGRKQTTEGAALPAAGLSAALERPRGKGARGAARGGRDAPGAVRAAPAPPPAGARARAAAAGGRRARRRQPPLRGAGAGWWAARAQQVRGGLATRRPLPRTGSCRASARPACATRCPCAPAPAGCGSAPTGFSPPCQTHQLLKARRIADHVNIYGSRAQFQVARKIPIAEERILRLKSRGCCAKCRRNLVGGRLGSESNLSIMAHIRGVAGRSARHDPSMDSTDVNRHRNLILLCGTCHKIVDDDPATYTPEHLEEMKLKHEAWAERQLIRDSKTTSFAELDVVTKWIMSTSSVRADADYAVTPPMKKIQKNHLSDEARMWIEIGMSKSHLVGKYLEAQQDPSFGERLKDGFRALYSDLRTKEELDADSTFFRLLATGGDVLDTRTRTPAVLAVLVYLFEKCEVFEK